VDEHILRMLCAPGTHEALHAKGDRLVSEDGREFPVRAGIPRLLPAAAYGGWQLFYDLAAFAYDPVLNLGARLGLGSEERIRSELLAKLAPASGSVVLEVGCGTGANRLAFGEAITYLGIDLSFGMLRQAQRTTARRSLPGAFVQGDAMALPVRSAQADMLLAMGVLQHIAAPGVALRELARVAKPGASLLLIDERRSLARVNRKISGQSVSSPANLIAALTTFEMDLVESVTIGEYYALRMSCHRGDSSSATLL
jgi:ubiquinone/menaquinone biosynthesis C-methylase UbiE/uncharacterized protein YbaR (Trm112 family)